MKKLHDRVFEFSGKNNVKQCTCDHELSDTCGVFYQSVKLIECLKCLGWQEIRKPIK